MVICTTFQEILDNADWDSFCEMRGINPWCLNEGLADSSEEVELTVEECARIGLRIG